MVTLVVAQWACKPEPEGARSACCLPYRKSVSRCGHLCHPLPTGLGCEAGVLCRITWPLWAQVWTPATSVDPCALHSARWIVASRVCVHFHLHDPEPTQQQPRQPFSMQTCLTLAFPCMLVCACASACVGVRPGGRWVEFTDR